MNSPKEVLAKEYSFHVGENITIRVLEEPPNTFTLVLPAAEAPVQELSDADMRAVAGGVEKRTWVNSCYDPCVTDDCGNW